jgi:RNA polymerase sigma factor (sigma-70 family)
VAFEDRAKHMLFLDSEESSLASSDEFDETVHSQNQIAQTAEAKLISRVESERLRRALEGLPATFKEVLLLREIEELSYKEISDVTGIPVGTVMSSLSRARQKSRERLGAIPGKED